MNYYHYFFIFRKNVGASWIVPPVIHLMLKVAAKGQMLIGFSSGLHSFSLFWSYLQLIAADFLWKLIRFAWNIKMNKVNIILIFFLFGISESCLNPNRRKWYHRKKRLKCPECPSGPKKETVWVKSMYLT